MRGPGRGVLSAMLQPEQFQKVHRQLFILRLILISALISASQQVLFAQGSYPKEIRGYKVERAAVELKGSKAGKAKSEKAATDEQLINFGTPRVAGITPLGISLEIPVVVAPVRQKGRVDFLVFEKMVVNGTSVEIDEYHRAFELPNNKPLTLKEPLRFYVYLPSAIMAAIDELSNSAKEWPITGVVYVFGRFKRSIFSFKRVIPVELDLKVPNPLREKTPA